MARHPDSGTTLEVPEGWQVEAPAGSDTLLALEPEGATPAPFRANVVLSVVDNQGMSFRDWQVATDQTLPGMLEDYLLLDLERLPVGGLAGGRRLAHHLSPDGLSLTLEQWFVAVGSLGVTLTATVDTWRYDELADLTATIAASLRLPVDPTGAAPC